MPSFLQRQESTPVTREGSDDASGSAAEDRPLFYRPLKTGFRFSAKARMPSFESSESSAFS